MTARRSASEQGQATIETMLLAGLSVILLASALQFYFVNRAITRSLVGAHASLMTSAFDRNARRLPFKQDLTVRWCSDDLPDVEVPVSGMFRSELDVPLRIEAHQHILEKLNRCPDARPAFIKKTAVAAGTATDVWGSLGVSTRALTNGPLLAKYAVTVPVAVGVRDGIGVGQGFTVSALQPLADLVNMPDPQGFIASALQRLSGLVDLIARFF